MILINGTQLAGVRMAPGSIAKLVAPISPKEFVSNESRLEDGKRVLYPSDVKFAPRELTITFQVTGSTESEFNTRVSAFYNAMYRGYVTLEVTDVSDDVYKLSYLGSSTYKGGMSGHACKITVKFEEPNPADRSDAE